VNKTLIEMSAIDPLEKKHQGQAEKRRCPIQILS
jgi:hypothetical protein